MRCPYGKKMKLYKRAKLEKFAHYLLPDGLATRLSIFGDRECMWWFKTVVDYVWIMIINTEKLWTIMFHN